MRESVLDFKNFPPYLFRHVLDITIFQTGFFHFLLNSTNMREKSDDTKILVFIIKKLTIINFLIGRF